MTVVQSELATEVAALLAPALGGSEGDRSAGLASGRAPVDRLWSLLSGYRKVGGLARYPDDELESDLAREIALVLRGNRPLQARVQQLLAEEYGARSA
jgi:hypothetical protein